MISHVLPGEDGGTTGGAERGGNKGVGKMSSLSSQTVKVRSFKELWGFIHETHEVITMVITEDDKNVCYFALYGRMDRCEQAEEDVEGSVLHKVNKTSQAL